jgi:hypothetical protein
MKPAGARTTAINVTHASGPNTKEEQIFLIAGTERQHCGDYTASTAK